MKILLINPNTSQSVSDLIEAEARRAAAPGTQVSVLTAPFGVAYIETRFESLIGAAMPEGYNNTADPNAVAHAVLGKSTWAVLALTCHIEMFTLVHYRQSIEPDESLSELWKDVFLFHWREESQHAILDELEWRREDAKLTKEQRDAGVTDLIELVTA